MLTHNDVKKIIRIYLKKEIASGKLYIGDRDLNRAKEALEEKAKHLSEADVQKTNETLKNKSSFFQRQCQDLGSRIESMAREIQPKQSNNEFLNVLRDYVRNYNQYKEAEFLIHWIENDYGTGPKNQKNQSEPEVKFAIKYVKADYPNEFIRRGEGWVIRYNGKDENIFSHRKGFTYIAYLILNQERQFHCDKLLQLEARAKDVTEPEKESDDSNDELEIGQQDGFSMVSAPLKVQAIDHKGFEKLKERLKKLRELLKNPHLSEKKEEEYQSELNFILNELSQSSGRNNIIRTRGESKNVKSVNKAISEAREAIRAHDPELAKHIRSSIKGGTFLQYNPRTTISWVVEYIKKSRK